MLDKGDILIDGGNTNFRDTIRRCTRCSTARHRIPRRGTSGGIWGLKVGYCMMIGGDEDAV